jgi:hypothetical protein
MALALLSSVKNLHNASGNVYREPSGSPEIRLC